MRRWFTEEIPLDTLRVDICYRPLRVGWVIKLGDTDAFRQAVKFSHTLWGGRFNPILMADREDGKRAPNPS